MIQILCDLCGEPITRAETHGEYKIKKRWYSWWESGWERIDAHEECVAAIAAAARERSEDACPAIEPKRGEWIYTQVRDYPVGYDEAACSLCGFSMRSNPHERFRLAEEVLKFKFCPMCGHPMGEEET